MQNRVSNTVGGALSSLLFTGSISQPERESYERELASWRRNIALDDLAAKFGLRVTPNGRVTFSVLGAEAVNLGNRNT